MILEDVIFFGADTGRSRAYIDLMGKQGLLPSAALIIKPKNTLEAAYVSVETPLFNNTTSLERLLENYSIPTCSVVAENINEPEVVVALDVIKGKYVVFSGPPGSIVREDLFQTGKRFLHVHPGKLPEYRGSTPMYYSLLAEDTLTATAIFLSAQIDEGGVINEKAYLLPEDKTIIDKAFDPWMRADLMVDVLNEYVRAGTLEVKKQEKLKANTYYIIHPVLKHIAILS